MPPSNKAAWLQKPKARLTVSSAPYTQPGPNEIVIRSRAIAVNLCDWAKQDLGDMIFPWVKYPFVLGEDVAGEVVEVGSSVSAFQIGDRVLGHAFGADNKSAGASEGAFQEYVVLQARLVARIPDAVTFERACVLPVCLSTAASGIHCEKYMGLSLPSIQNYSPKEGKKAGKVLVVWGASTAVGMNCVQLGVAAGYTVIATAGKHNFDYVRSLGAHEVFDYRSAGCVGDIIKATQKIGTGCAGAVAIGAWSIIPCIDIVSACCKGTDKKYVAQMSLIGPGPPQPGALNLMSWLAQVSWAWATTLVKKSLKGVKVEFVWGSDLYNDGVAEAVYGDFLPSALAQGRFVPAPEPQIVGHGLDKVQEAFEVGKKGVSAKKIVVTV
ncbi:zinc-binding oxidoreductase [Diaporthe amygdali]|uniref:zinc-binding oxidoreductase n=1 Tax=Phomopsis amygdali TaxID=1214568 RepID=UPI0022FEBE99|nr:zinc-binding oxidoreductase [Diaporthe amygdali]KAJ0117500.1 zinc-binding oxidoreductase [Diaporthe amygdali]